MMVIQDVELQQDLGPGSLAEQGFFLHLGWDFAYSALLHYMTVGVLLVSYLLHALRQILMDMEAGVLTGFHYLKRKPVSG